MKLYTVVHQGRTLVCLETQGGTLVPLPYQSMNHLLMDEPESRDAVLERAAQSLGTLTLGAVEVLAPIPQPRQDIICLGMNYQAHKSEAEDFDAEAFTRQKGKAVYFSKRASHCPGPGASIPGHFDLVDSLDYETELAVVLGRDAKNVAEADAFDYVFGYTIVNDISARNLQTGHKQWTFGKGLDGFAPMGPCLVTKDAFAQPPALPIRTWVNGEARQDAVTDQLIFSIPHIIHELSQGMTLLAGTIIATGTPAGVGMGFTPPKFLKAGDTVRCEIEGIGVLEHTIL
ncbi:MAG: fumarylacetoacetate hydrolase family protein [Ruminiclostridium sp.]|jgi:2-keto-4-pentenoate hydratase/2-oxohepta-3-ene-1,7-dioic acid hydratase in catechol pathway|nr:fumarylacetoacetate hydrolase family protein [Ruminiclostridium sp.]